MLQALGLVGGEYRLRREIGRGSFGAVYAARSEVTNRIVALKLLSRFDATSLERFEREGELLLRLPPHRHVVRVLRAGRHGSLPFIAMELVAGGSLASALRAGHWPTHGQAVA